MKIELTEEEIAHITYALREMANRRQEQALTYHHNIVARHTNLEEAAALRRLEDNIERQKLEQ